VPLHYRYYVSRVPVAMTVMFMAGMMSGAFYGLAPVYGVAQGMNTSQVAVFVAAAVASGLVFQWPVGWLADRISRVALIRFNALLLAAFTLPLWGWWPLPYPVLVMFSCLFGIILFTLYPVAAAFANDNVDPDRRVGLSAIMYMVYGLGAGVGPLFVGFLMREMQAGVFFVFVSACAIFLVAFVRPQRITGNYLSEDAPTGFVPMPESSQTQNVVPALDPRVDLDTDVSFTTPPEDPPAESAEQPVAEADGSEAANAAAAAEEGVVIPSDPAVADVPPGILEPAAGVPSPEAVVVTEETLPPGAGLGPAALAAAHDPTVLAAVEPEAEAPAESPPETKPPPER